MFFHARLHAVSDYERSSLSTTGSKQKSESGYIVFVYFLSKQRRRTMKKPITLFQ